MPSWMSPSEDKCRIGFNIFQDREHLYQISIQLKLSHFFFCVFDNTSFITSFIIHTSIFTCLCTPFKHPQERKKSSQCRELEKNYVLVLSTAIKMKIIFIICLIQGTKQALLLLFLYIARIVLFVWIFWTSKEEALSWKIGLYNYKKSGSLGTDTTPQMLSNPFQPLPQSSPTLGYLLVFCDILEIQI